MAEKTTRESKRELWRYYMANIITMLGDRDTKAFSAIIEDYDRALANATTREDEIEMAYDSANAILAQLDKARKGV